MIAILRQMACLFSALLLIFSTEAQAAEQKAREAGRTKAVFSVSWQPGFCRTRSERPECKAETQDGFSSTHFTLHGLWPVGKSYCGVDVAAKTQDRKGEWLDLPRPELAGEAMVTLATVMPGVQSGLDRHQWLRSGRCYSASAEAYFEGQMRYLDALNRSAVRSLFVEKLGGMVTEQEVRQAFDTAFGPGAGERVRLHCAKTGKEMTVTGVTIGLGDSGIVTPVPASAGASEQGNAGADAGSVLSALILAADATHGKCASGTIARVEAR